MTATADAAPQDDGKITCHIDGKRVHSIQIHLKNFHPGWTVEKYQDEFPGQPLLSAFAQQKLDEAAKKRIAAATPATTRTHGAGVIGSKALHEVFDLGSAKAAMNARGEPIMITVYDGASPENAALIPDIDTDYIYDIETLKNAIIGFELGKTQYNWGYHGTGKTTLFEQICARTGRPFMRVQHTIDTEGSHITGQYVVRDGGTAFQPGPLAVAMIEGQVYCADEYDFGLPSVVSVYQPVLEGKPLVIKDAPPELRVIRPHKDFRFVATGNTNGSGDETGLYQGTQIQNAANYSRFQIVQEMHYLEPKVETAIIAGKAKVDLRDAKKIVDAANEIRDAFKSGRIGSTISTREIINAAELGLVRGGDWRTGMRLGYSARSSRTDKEVVEQFFQRIFG